MKYLPLIWAGLWRKKTRTFLTLLSILVAFILFGLLQGVNAAFNHSVAGANINRLDVQSRVSYIEPLPFGHLTQIESVPGVTKVAYVTWFGPYYQDPKDVIFSYAIDPRRFLSIYPELKLPDEQLVKFSATRTAGVISADAARKYGWKIGDRVPLRSTIWTRKSDGTSDWSFDIVGVFDASKAAGSHPDFLINYAYFDEERAFARGTVGRYIVQIADPNKAALIGAAIDKLFENSINETKTQSEKETAQAFLKQQGDINLMVTLIVSAVFFTLLFLTGNTLMQSVNERIPEFAVLKVLGFSGAAVSALILCESLLLCVIAALIGLALAWSAFPLLQGSVGVAAFPTIILSTGIGIAALLALVISLPPTIRLQSLKLVDALADR